MHVLAGNGQTNKTNYNMMTYFKKILVLLLFILFILKSNYSENINSIQAFDFAAGFLLKANSKFGTENILLKSDYFEIADNNENLAFVFRLYPRGFVIVSAFSTISPVIGFSLSDNFPEGEILEEHPVYSIIRGISNSHK